MLTDVVGAKPAKPNGQRQCQEPLRNQKEEFKNQSWQHNRETASRLQMWGICSDHL